MPSRYRAPEEATSRTAAHRLALPFVALAVVAAGACSRTGLEVDETTVSDVTDAGRMRGENGGATARGPRDAAISNAFDAALAPDAPALPDATPGPTSTTGEPTEPPPTKPPPTTPPTKPPPNCTPHDETCNGHDDDCDGKVDEDLPPIPCAGGGEQYCVAGRFSACPVRCETCIPGSERVCFLSYCTYWATQTCAADGRSFGTCREHHVPPECESIAHAHKDSIELEKCCVDNGYCCHDEYDLDHDGNRSEMLGRCDEVSCK